MPTRRRWLQFNLRAFFVLLTAMSVWLAWIVHQAREQREAVKAIEAMGGGVHYDSQPTVTFLSDDQRLVTLGTPRARPNWLSQIIGIDFVHNVDGAVLKFTSSDSQFEMERRVKEAIPSLSRLSQLKRVIVQVWLSSEERTQTVDDVLGSLREALPDCQVSLVRFKE